VGERILRAIAARSRLLVAAAVGCGVGSLLPTGSVLGRTVIAWDVGAALFLAQIFVMMARSDRHELRARALREDEGAVAVLALTVGAAGISLVALVAELSEEGPGFGFAGSQLAVVLTTLFLSWAFVHTIFALHYAHEYELGREAAPGEPVDIAGGLDFQNPEPPDYFDFVYFSFVIGVAAQTADVTIKRRRLRRVATVHCIVTFIFNATILALAINLAAAAF
jgi:uncharacterized membrane protein